MKNNFDLQRFTFFLQREIILHKSTYLNFTLRTMLVFLFTTLPFSLKFWINLVPVSEHATDNIAHFSSMFYMVMVMLAFSISFANLETKQKRVAFLTLPASQLEKYLGRIGICAVIGILVPILSFIFIDGLRFCIESTVWGPSAHCSIPEFFRSIAKVSDLNISAIDMDIKNDAYLNGMWVYAATFFILCSTVFRNKAFIKGIGCYSLVNIIVVTILTTILVNIPESDIDKADFPKGMLFIALNICNIKLWLVSILNVYWSWTNYKKISVL